ncbi:white protein, putative [Eimeria necatrix]|uniref:White protein, putative n=1 Tax=Eimeria necatrix TaxID=51315 RepID=U6MTP8_9EIME|nr:white protein, putative [Eimeria necatrix]CDJ67567.1 white protein, putative [Eimeria necatrix]
MPASQEEVLRHISNAMPPAGAGDCCEALNAAASEVFLRRRSMQSLKSGRSSVDRRSVCGDGEVPAVTESGTTPPSDADEQNLTYERLKNLRPCPPVTISFDELSLKVNVHKRFTGVLALPFVNQIARAVTPSQSKTLLMDVSGTVHPGEMVALMGASGAGKSTLLNVLSRRIVTNGGSVLFNGKTLGPAEVKRICCYIQQSDIFYGFLTVEEHLDCVARLRTGWKKEERSKLVDRLVELYGLTKVRNSRIGNIQMAAKRGISGGEKKRLNIATEMMTNPSVIFADEPTTGLDSFIAENVMRIFRHLADRGRTIICTIHQPSSNIFNMFSKVLLLSQGRVVFYGDREATLLYFSRLGLPCPPFTSVPEFLLELLVKQQLRQGKQPDDAIELTPEKLAERWKHTGVAFVAEWANVREKHIQAMQDAGAFQSGHGGQDAEISKTETRSPVEMELEPAKELSDKYKPSWSEELCTLIHRSFISNRKPWYGFCATNVHQRQGVGRTRVPGRSVPPYLVLLRIAWYMVGLNDAPVRWLLGLLFILLATNSAISIGYVISSVAPTLQFASTMIPILFMPLVLMSGFMVILSNMPRFWIWLQYISPFRWGWSGVMHAVWEGVELDPCPPEVLPPQCYSTGEQVLRYYALDQDSYWFSALMLLIQIILYRLLGLGFLLLINRRK